MSLLGPVLWLLATLATGDRMLSRLDPRPRAAAYHLSLSFLLGLAGSTTLAFWWSAAGLPLAPWLPPALALPFLAWAAGSRRELAPTPAPGRLPVALLALFVALPLAKSLWEPMRGWDARTVFATYAAALSDEGSVRGPTFTDPTRTLTHPNYPLLVPLAQWQLACWSGGRDDRTVMVLFPLCELAMLGCVWGALASRVAAPWPGLATAAAAGVPFLYAVPDGSVPSGYADVPLAAMAAAFCAAAWDVLDGEGGEGVLALAFAGMTFTKRGGLPLGLLGLALLLAFAPRRRAVLLGALGGAALLVPWWLHQASLATAPAQNYVVRLYMVAVERGALASQGPGLLGMALRDTFLRPNQQALFWWAFLASVPSALRRPGPRVMALLALGYLGAVYLFLLRSGTSAEAVNAYSWGRYILPALPAAALALGGAMAGPSGSSDRDGRPH